MKTIGHIFSVAGFHFRGWRKNPRIFLTFGLGFVLCFLLSNKVMGLVESQNYEVQLMEPFIWTFGDSESILLAASLLILLLGDLPRLSGFTPLYLSRMNRKTWLLGQGLYVLVSTFLYLAFLLLSTMVLCGKNAFPGNVWSRTAVLLGYSAAGENIHLPSSVRTMEGATPYGCAVTIFLLMLFYALLMAMLMLFATLRRSQRAGVLTALIFSAYGYLLKPEVFGKIFGLQDGQMYRVRVALGWLSPLNHATYPMHNFGTDLLPRLQDTYLLFGGLFFLILLVCLLAAKHYSFFFGGTEGAYD